MKTIKQQPTLEQWNEFSEEQKLVFWIDTLKEHAKHAPGISDLGKFVKDKLPTIGQMIEFLGEDWIWQLLPDSETKIIPDIENLCDDLWRACKVKLGV